MTNGDFSTDSDWNKNSNWSISGNTANCDGTSNGDINQGTTLATTGKSYRITFDIVSISQGEFFFKFGGVNGTFRNSIGTYTETIQAINSNRIALDSLNNAIGSIDNVSVKEVISATNTPRIDYSTGAEAFLLEPQSTNLITQSELFSDSSWVKNGFGNALAPVVTLNSNISPDGTQNASRIEMDCTSTLSSDYSAMYQQLALDGSSDYTISFYVKSNTSSEQDLLFFSNSSFSTQITANSEWQRVESTFTSNSTNAKKFWISG